MPRGFGRSRWGTPRGWCDFLSSYPFVLKDFKVLWVGGEKDKGGIGAQVPTRAFSGLRSGLWRRQRNGFQPRRVLTG